MKKRITAVIVAILALTGAWAGNDRIYLSGTGLDDAVMWDFKVSGGQQSGRWKKIAVPSSWEPQGFGDYTYGRWYTVKGATPSSESGHYRRRFSLPRLGAGERVKLFFDGVMTDARVMVNGRQAGEPHQGGFYRFSYDITPLVGRGNNTLEVIVDKHSANKSINAAERKADWWLFGGIYRPVWLEIVPEVNMRHVILDARHDGSLKATVETEGDARGYTVKASVAGATITSASATDSVITLEGHVDGVAPWSHESPRLYTATVELVDPSGKTVQSRQIKTGFRTIEFRPRDGLYLNGNKIILKGVNRHSFTVDGGRTTSPRNSREDVELIKQMNMNAVRSHYPPDEHFLDACDSIGLLYIDELAGWHDRYDDTVAPRLVKEMIERDVNHPCIIIWSNGNEGGWNKKIDSHFAMHDPLQRRHVIHPWADFNDLDTHHYPAYLTGVARFTNGYKVFMPTEFMHAMYDQGGGAGLRDFWDRWLTNPMFAGGFIWAFTDEAPRRLDRGGELDSDGSNAPDGLLGPRREREGSFYAVRAQWSPIRLKPLLITKQWDGTFKVTNEWDCVNLADCMMQYRLVSIPSPANDVAPREHLLAAGQVELPAIGPGETGTARIELPSVMAEADLLQLAAFGPDGRQVAEWSVPCRLAADYQSVHWPAMASPRGSTIERSGDRLTLANGALRVTFNTSTGLIDSIIKGDVAIPLTNGPRAVGGKMVIQPDDSSARVDADGSAVYCARYKGMADSIVWRLTPDGLLSMKALLLNRASGGRGFDDAFMDTEVYNLGLTFSYPEQDVEGMTWMGRGPYRVWKNRMEGANIGLWHKDYNNTVTGESYSSLIYPEFKGYHGNIYWSRIEDRQSPWTLYSDIDGLYLQVFTPEEPAAGGGKTMPAFPDGDLSLLLDIPAIRSFKPIEQQGPGSQPGNIRIKSGDEGLHIDVTFDFR